MTHQLFPTYVALRWARNAFTSALLFSSVAIMSAQNMNPPLPPSQGQASGASASKIKGVMQPETVSKSASASSSVAGGFLGSTMSWQYYAYGGAYGSGDSCCSGTFVDGDGGGTDTAIGGVPIYFTISADDSSITFNYSVDSIGPDTWSASALSLSPTIYNGIAVNISSGPTLTSVTIDPSTNMAGFDATHVSFAGSQIQVDWQNLPFNTSTIVKLDLNNLETLTLTELGLGSGTVTDNTGQIDCSEASGVVTGKCSASYATGTLVILAASPQETSTFGGWGGACASFGTTTPCSLTMNSAQNVSASFNAPGPTQAGTVMTGTETVFNFQGGVGNGGYDYNVELTSGPPVMAQVTAIPVVDQLTCNAIVNPTFPGAQCFVYQNGNGPNTPSPVMFELTCPGSPGGTCGTDINPTFFATLGTDFNFSKGLNLLFNSTEPLVGWLKGVGPLPLHPCTQNAGNTPPLFHSNQISSFSSTGDPIGSGKGTSGGTGSCWLLTYNTPNEAPSVNIVAPANGGVYQQNQVTHASYACTTVNNTPNATGPYLTQGSCSATDTPGGSVAQGAQFDTATLGPHTFTATVVDSATNTVSQTVTYTVVGAADVAILKLAPPKVRSGTKLTYLIGVGDFGPAKAVNVSVNDPLPPGTAFLSASGTNLACSIVNGKFTCSTTHVPCAFAGGVVSCNAGTVMPFSLWFLNGAVIQITVQVTAPAGTLNNTATVSASNADPKTGNNSSTASTTVTAY
jgi:uncharacterized repeat protein (TIGR01451 family)